MNASQNKLCYFYISKLHGLLIAVGVFVLIIASYYKNTCSSLNEIIFLKLIFATLS